VATETKHNIVPDLVSLAVPIDSLVRLPGNPRRNDAEVIARSLERWGQRKPVVVRRDGSVIEAGNHTWDGAVLLGWTHIAAVFVDDDETSATGFALADNRLHDLGSDDPTALALMIQGIKDEELVLLDAGFDALSIDELLAPLELAEVGPEGNTLNDGRTPAERAASYESNGLRSFILTYAMGDYEDLAGRLQKLRGEMSLDTNAEVVLRLIKASS
jgi:ParB-like chromosome segregation protein Spo0J